MSQLYTYVATALIALIVGVTGAWKVQDWRYAAKEKDRVEAQAEVDRIAHISNIKRIDAVVDAQNRAASRAVSNRADADAARNELERVRSLSDSALAAASASQAACLDRAAALNDVFKSCTVEVGGMAEKADRHVNDIRTLIESWPK